MTILENRKESFKNGLSCGNELWLVGMLQREDKFRARRGMRRSLGLPSDEQELAVARQGVFKGLLCGL
jgi:hypothetical protein